MDDRTERRLMWEAHRAERREHRGRDLYERISLDWSSTAGIGALRIIGHHNGASLHLRLKFTDAATDTQVLSSLLGIR